MLATVQRGWEMREVKVRKTELLEKIKSNRIKHVAEYEEACAGYKAAAILDTDYAAAALTEQVNSLKEGNMIELMYVSFNLAVPQDHSADYDQVITMLEMSVDEELTINSDEFACYVMDNWKWRQEWEATKSTYNARR